MFSAVFVIQYYCKPDMAENVLTFYQFCYPSAIWQIVKLMALGNQQNI